MKKNRIRTEKIKPPKLPMGVRLLLYFITLLFGILSIAETIYEHFYYAVDIFIYVVAACSLAVTCYYLTKDITGAGKKIVRLAIEGNAFINRIYSDYRYRTVLFTLFSFLLNMIFAISNGIFGILNHSPWLGTLSAYYIFLSIMRFGTVRYERKVSKEKPDKDLIIQELNVYRNTGILLALITIALGGAVILLVNHEGGKSYPGYMIFVVAMYTFYKAIISVINIVRARKLKSPLLVTIRNIGYADALVSVLSLQTAMFESFGENSNIEPWVMNGITGACVCIMILAIGIYMIYSSGRQKKLIQNEIYEEL